VIVLPALAVDALRYALEEQPSPRDRSRSHSGLLARK
jgi:hypothetical protein